MPKRRRKRNAINRYNFDSNSIGFRNTNHIYLEEQMNTYEQALFNAYMRSFAIKDYKDEKITKATLCEILEKFPVVKIEDRDIPTDSVYFTRDSKN